MIIKGNTFLPKIMYVGNNFCELSKPVHFLHVSITKTSNGKSISRLSITQVLNICFKQHDFLKKCLCLDFKIGSVSFDFINESLQVTILLVVLLLAAFVLPSNPVIFRVKTLVSEEALKNLMLR